MESQSKYWLVPHLMTILIKSLSMGRSLAFQTSMPKRHLTWWSFTQAHHILAQSQSTLSLTTSGSRRSSQTFNRSLLRKHTWRRFTVSLMQTRHQSTTHSWASLILRSLYFQPQELMQEPTVCCLSPISQQPLPIKWAAPSQSLSSIPACRMQ
jgi:hypothetical protein